jgi:hypothetical protein
VVLAQLPAPGWADDRRPRQRRVRRRAGRRRRPLGPHAGPDSDRDERTAPQRRADALAEIVRRALEAGDLPAAGGIRPQVTVTVDLDTLLGRLGPAAVLPDGTTISAATARMLACDAAILPAVLGTASEPLDLGRAARLATQAQRRALALHYRGCAFPGCGRPPAWTIAHHVRHWVDGGTTDLGNLVPLCEHHHTVIHHDGWTISRNGHDGEFDFTPPRRVDPLRRPQRQPWLRR